jgi:hypothetical protein
MAFGPTISLGNGREPHFPTADLPNASIPGLFWRSENTIVVRAGPCTRSAEREEIIEILVARHGIADRRLLSVGPIARDCW